MVAGHVRSRITLRGGRRTVRVARASAPSACASPARFHDDVGQVVVANRHGVVAATGPSTEPTVQTPMPRTSRSLTASSDGGSRTQSHRRSAIRPISAMARLASMPSGWNHRQGGRKLRRCGRQQQVKELAGCRLAELTAQRRPLADGLTGRDALGEDRREQGVEVAATTRPDALQPVRVGHDGVALGDLDRQPIDGGHLERGAQRGRVLVPTPRPRAQADQSSVTVAGPSGSSTRAMLDAVTLGGRISTAVLVPRQRPAQVSRVRRSTGSAIGIEPTVPRLAWRPEGDRVATSARESFATFIQIRSSASPSNSGVMSKRSASASSSSPRPIE